MEVFCPQCSRHFDSQESLRQHNLARHAVEEKEGQEEAHAGTKASKKVEENAEDAFALVAGALALLALASAWIALGIKSA